MVNYDKIENRVKVVYKYVEDPTQKSIRLRNYRFISAELWAKKNGKSGESTKRAISRCENVGEVVYSSGKKIYFFLDGEPWPPTKESLKRVERIKNATKQGLNFDE